MKTESTSCQSCPALKSSLFRELSPDQLARLQQSKQGIEIERGETLNRQGEPANGAYCIAKGNLKISWPGPDKESIVRIASRGDMTGYRCLFSEEKFRGTAVALEPVSACFIPKATFFSLVEESPRFSFGLLQLMGMEIAAAESRLNSFCQKSVRERMAEALLILKKICGRENDGRWTLEIQISREELSSWIGAAKETVVRTLSEFKEEKLILQDGTQLVVLDPAGLASVAGLARESAPRHPLLKDL